MKQISSKSGIYFLKIQEYKCLVISKPLATIMVFFRTITDLIYLLHMLLQVTDLPCFETSLLCESVVSKSVALLHSSGSYVIEAYYREVSSKIVYSLT